MHFGWQGRFAKENNKENLLCYETNRKQVYQEWMIIFAEVQTVIYFRL